MFRPLPTVGLTVVRVCKPARPISISVSYKWMSGDFRHFGLNSRPISVSYKWTPGDFRHFGLNSRPISVSYKWTSGDFRHFGLNISLFKKLTNTIQKANRNISKQLIERCSCKILVASSGNDHN